MIKVSGLTISLGGKQIIKGIDFDACTGEYLSLIGPNGSGKSTVLRSLCRIVPFMSGSVMISGKDINEFQPRLLASEITYVSQLPPSELSVKDFVMLSRYPYMTAFGGFSRNDADAVSDSLRATCTSDLSDRKLSELSSGERQRVAVASALAQDTRIILFDEPVTHLDPYYDGQISELIYSVAKKRNLTVINATHSINNAMKYSDRILALRNGSVAFQKRTADVGSSDISKLYGVEFISLENPGGREKVMVRS